jgi:hypothetical protein
LFGFRHRLEEHLDPSLLRALETRAAVLPVLIEHLEDLASRRVLSHHHPATLLMSFITGVLK